jgi:hypothetical protein
MINYKNKYLKYKNKYLNLRGGGLQDKKLYIKDYEKYNLLYFYKVSLPIELPSKTPTMENIQNYLTNDKNEILKFDSYDYDSYKFKQSNSLLESFLEFFLIKLTLDDDITFPLKIPNSTQEILKCQDNLYIMNNNTEFLMFYVECNFPQTYMDILKQFIKDDQNAKNKIKSDVSFNFNDMVTNIIEIIGTSYTPNIKVDQFDITKAENIVILTKKYTKPTISKGKGKGKGKGYNIESTISKDTGYDSQLIFINSFIDFNGFVVYKSNELIILHLVLDEYSPFTSKISEMLEQTIHSLVHYKIIPTVITVSYNNQIDNIKSGITILQNISDKKKSENEKKLTSVDIHSSIDLFTKLVEILNNKIKKINDDTQSLVIEDVDELISKLDVDKLISKLDVDELYVDISLKETYVNLVEQLLEKIKELYKTECIYYINNKKNPNITITKLERTKYTNILLNEMKIINNYYITYNNAGKNIIYNYIIFVSNMLNKYYEYVLVMFELILPAYKPIQLGSNKNIFIFNNLVLSQDKFIQNPELVLPLDFNFCSFNYSIDTISLLIELNKLVNSKNEYVCTQLLKIIFDIKKVCFFYVYDKYKCDLYELLRVHYNNTLTKTDETQILTSKILLQIQDELIEKLDIFAKSGYKCSDIKLENILCDNDNHIFIHDFDDNFCKYPIMDDNDILTLDQYSLIYYLIIYYETFYIFNISLDKLLSNLSKKKNECLQILDIIHENIPIVFELLHDYQQQIDKLNLISKQTKSLIKNFCYYVIIMVYNTLYTQKIYDKTYFNKGKYNISEITECINNLKEKITSYNM